MEDSANLTQDTEQLPQNKKRSGKSVLLLAGLITVGALFAIAFYTNSKKENTPAMQQSSDITPTIKATEPKSMSENSAIQKELESFAGDFNTEELMAEVVKTLNAPPSEKTPSPTPIPTPTITFSSTGDISTASAKIESLRLYNGGIHVPTGGTLTNNSPTIIYMDIASESGSGLFEKPILLRFSWVIGGKRIPMETKAIIQTGLAVQTSLSGLFDRFQYPELDQATEATLEIQGEVWATGERISSLSETYSFQFDGDANKTGTYSIVVSAASDRSQPDVLDRKIIVGADISLFDANSKLVAKLKTNGGVDVFRNLPAQQYGVQADYKGYGSFSKTVVIGEDNPHGSAFLIVPIKPNLVEDYRANIRGMISTGYYEFYEKGLMKNQPVRLMRVENGNTVGVVATTTTDEWGAYSFPNIPGDMTYRIEFNPPPGWRVTEDASKNTFQVFSIKDRVENVSLNKVFN